MTMTDPIADMLTRIRNATLVGRTYVLVPSSRVKRAIARVLKSEGYVGRFETIRQGRFPVLKIYLKYTKDRKPVLRGLKRISKPGCRIYTKKKGIPWVKSGLGNVILSTPRGIVSGREARTLNVGGEILCEVW